MSPVTHNYPQLNESQRKGMSHVAIMCSPSHTYGNALAYIQNWIINLFPEDFFKTYHISSKLAHRQLRLNGKQEFFKKEKPILAVRPRIDVNEDRFLKSTLFTERQYDITSSYNYGPLQPFFLDREREIAIRYQLNRSVMYVDATIVLGTLMEMIDIENYMRNAVRIGHPFTLETVFESYLPMDMLNLLGEIGGVPVEDARGNTKDFLSYMNGHSHYPITFKMNGANGIKEFYRYYPVHIDTIISDLNMGDGEKSGQVTSNYTITFSMRLEFYTAGMYFLYSPYISKTKRIMGPKLDGKSIVPIFSDVEYREDYDFPVGWAFYRRFSLRLESSKELVPIETQLNESLIYAIDYHLDNGLPMMDLINFRIRRQGKIIIPGIDYIIDYEKKAIQFLNKDYGYYTYSVVISVNVEYNNDLIRKTLKLE